MNATKRRALTQIVKANETEPEIRVACYQYYQPSLVFYSKREVRRLEKDGEAVEFLSYPVPVYLFLPAAAWESLQRQLIAPCRVLGRHLDLYRGYEVVLVSNH